MSEDTQPVEWVKFYPEKWMAGTQGLSAAEIGIYISVVACNMSSGRGVTMRTLERRFRDEDVSAVVEELRLDGKVHVEGEKVWNNKAIATYEEAAAYRQAMKERSEKGVAARKAKADQKDDDKKDNKSNRKSTTRSTHTYRQTDSHTDKQADSKPGKPGPDEKSYVFDGEVIRLTKKDYDQWEKSFPLIDLRRELEGIDRWIVKNGVKGAWFARVSALLKKANDEAAEERDRGLDDAADLAGVK